MLKLLVYTFEYKIYERSILFYPYLLYPGSSNIKQMTKKMGRVTHLVYSPPESFYTFFYCFCGKVNFSFSLSP